MMINIIVMLVFAVLVHGNEGSYKFWTPSIQLAAVGSFIRATDTQSDAIVLFLVVCFFVCINSF